MTSNYNFPLFNSIKIFILIFKYINIYSLYYRKVVDKDFLLLLVATALYNSLSY